MHYGQQGRPLAAQRVQQQLTATLIVRQWLIGGGDDFGMHGEITQI